MQTKRGFFPYRKDRLLRQLLTILKGLNVLAELSAFQVPRLKGYGDK